MVEEMLAACGTDVSHESVHHWAEKHRQSVRWPHAEKPPRTLERHASVA
jgi:transposase-like protein